MANTQPVNFRADSAFYQQTKAILADEKLTLSDVFNAALRKIATGAVDAKEFVSSDLTESQYQIAFEDLKKGDFTWASRYHGGQGDCAL